MGFNNAKERRKFEDEWVKLRKQYREAGFSEESIAAMREYDEEAYRSNRRFEEHSQQMPSEDFGEDGDENRTSLFGKFGSFAVTFDENDFESRYAWVDTVNDPKLASGLKQLKESDLELLTLIAVDGYGQREIARLLGCNHNAIWKKIARIKKFLENF